MTNKPDGKPPADKRRPVYVTSRLRYFDGEFLKTEDFVDEQNYHVDRQTRHEARLHAPGVLEGLRVWQTADQMSSLSVTVGIGSALDTEGNQILINRPTEVVLDPVAGDGDYIVDIKFDEMTTDPQPGSEGATRFTQEPGEMLAIGTSPRPGAVPLARVRVTGEVIDAIDTDYFSSSGPTQKYAGVKLPGPSGKEATLRVENVSDDPNGYPDDSGFNLPDYKVLLSASGGLEVDGPMTVSDTLMIQNTLDVTGLLTASGGLEVNDNGVLKFNNATRQMISLNDGSSSGIGTQTDTVYFRSNYGFAFYQGGTHNNDKQAPGTGGKHVLAIGNGGNVLIPKMLTIGQGENMDGPSDILEVHDTQDETALLFTVGRSKIDASIPLNAKGGLTVTGTATVSETLTADSSLNVTGLLTANGGFGVSSTKIYENGTMSIGHASSDSSHPLEVWDSSGNNLLVVTSTGINAKIELNAQAGLAVTGTATVSDTLTAKSSLNVTGLLTANGGFEVSSTQIYENGTMSIGHASSDSSHLLEVWDSSGNNLLAVTSTGINAKIELNAQAGLAVTGTATVSDTLTASEYTFPDSATLGDTPPMIKARRVPSGQGNDTGDDIERSELILFAGNDITDQYGPDAITLRAPALRLQTYNDASVEGIDNDAGCNDRLYIDPNGRVSIGKSYYPNNASNWLEVWDPSSTDSTCSAMLEVHNDVINTSVPLNAKAGLAVTGTATVSDTLTAQSSLNVTGLLTANDGLKVTGTVQMLGSWVEVNGSPYTISEDTTPTICNTTAAESDGFAVVRLSMNGDGDDARGWVELWTSPQGSGGDIRLGRCSNHQNSDKCVIQDNSVTAPIRKGDGWYVKGSCTQHDVVVSVYWIPFGNN
ncbi:hypothetical protein [Luteimonas salinilitoris]|uniref:Uncharacterized protein n=1 Tax=Luteimonas salinilitoris TaxID=3237697 RepID=A0ABV4HT78_9GAMM